MGGGIAAGAAFGACGDAAGPREPFFGDLHVHTRLSYDAYVFGNRVVGPAQAYRAARGEEIEIPPLLEGLPNRTFRLRSGPVDFAAVTDHAEWLGEVTLCTTPGARPDTWLSGEVGLQLIRDGFRDEGTLLIDACAAYRAADSLAEKAPIETICPPDGDPVLCPIADAFRAGVWSDLLDAAEEAYEPCAFTTFAGYEWTSLNGENGSEGKNHRNVLYRDVASLRQADGTPALLPLSRLDVQTPSHFREIVRRECLGIPGNPDWPGLPGCDVVAIPHTSNDSRGTMFLLASDEPPAERLAMEPVIEIIQHKTSSECSPFSHPDDPYCTFEPYSRLVGDDTPESVAPGFVRRGLNAGLQAAQASGDTNPYQFGFIGGTDTHNGLPGSAEEDNYVGHLATNDATLGNRLNPFNVELNPGGLAGVWASENTRDAIFDALARRETFATSGPRITVRLAATWRVGPPLPDAPLNACARLQRDRLADVTLMGAALPAAPSPDAYPQLIVVAGAAPTGDDLVETHIVKAQAGADGRVREETIVLAEGEGDAGRRQVCRAWHDPGFDPTRPAYYYVRVLERPTPRYSKRQCDLVTDQWDCEAPGGVPVQLRACCDERFYTDIQERAWSSPVYFDPNDAAM